MHVLQRLSLHVPADAFFSFTGGALSVSIQLESAASNSSNSSSKLLRRLGLRKERATAMLSADVINAFAPDGFVYVGRAQLSKHPKQQASTSNVVPEKASAAAGLLPDYVSAVRFTPQGHVYIQRQQEQSQDTAAQATGDLSIPPLIPNTTAAKHLAAVAQSKVSKQPPSRRLQQHGRHLSIIVGEDDRQTCPQLPAYPYTAIGQIDFEEANTPYICSGALISARRVLTAAHCVWDIDTESFVDVLSFAPGRYRTGDGRMVNPFGVYNWVHATLMKNYIASQETQGDIALIQLDSPVSKDAGTLGLKGQCQDESNVKLTTAGYPSDKPEGECVMATCTVSFNCEEESTRHHCDTYMGQSGSAFWDDRYYVRGVHVRGLIDEDVNEFTTVSRRIIGKIRDWENRESGGVV